MTNGIDELIEIAKDKNFSNEHLGMVFRNRLKSLQEATQPQDFGKSEKVDEGEIDYVFECRKCGHNLFITLPKKR